MTRDELLFAVALGVLSLVLYTLMQQPQPSKIRRTFPQPLTPPWHPQPLITITTPYNEDEIVEIVKDIYKVLIKLCYIAADDIAWPSEEVTEAIVLERGVIPQRRIHQNPDETWDYEPRHPINEELCEKLHLAPSVISLMKKLPYPKDERTAGGLDLWPHSRPLCYLEDQEILQGRDPERLYDDRPQFKGGPLSFRDDYLLPQDICLTWQGDEEGWSIVLDTWENTVRMVDFDGPQEPDSPQEVEYERPDEPSHYRNYPTQHAPSILRRHLERIKSLDLIPSTSGISQGLLGEDTGDEWTQRQVKKILIERYGWPDNFKREEWQREGENLWDRLIRESMDRNDWLHRPWIEESE